MSVPAAIPAFNTADPLQWKDRLLHGGADDDAQLEAVAREFEGVFLRTYLNEAFRPITKDGGFFGAGGSPVYQFLITESIASALAQKEVFGFTSLIQSQLAARLESPSENSSDA
ncbi:MAG: hypothetical protein EA425_02720 [Puniceicoccaceae bacterium]|nr:MAG: hypothetical protein EA425_02720 [Puniceicoccaceae bacterium]